MDKGPQHLWGNQRLSVNDCFLRNMHKYKYIANIDDDEIILPQNATSWPEMMEVVEKMSQNETVGCWRFQNALFLDTMPTIGNESRDVPTDLHMMQHIYRAKVHFPIPKSISNTETVLIP